MAEMPAFSDPLATDGIVADDADDSADDDAPDPDDA
jgi:hypothetical protein